MTRMQIPELALPQEVVTTSWAPPLNPEYVLCVLVELEYDRGPGAVKIRRSADRAQTYWFPDLRSDVT